MVRPVQALTDTAERSEAALRRSSVHWNLAELLLHCPDERVMADLRRALDRNPGTDASDDLAAGLVALGKLVPVDPADVDDLAVEYTRLFGAVSADYGPPPPYESGHRGSSAAAEVAAAVGDFYAAAGLSPADNGAPPDHLGIELKFLALLCHEEGGAWRAGRADDARRILRQERDFLGTHVMQWAPAYLATIGENTRHPFYRHVAALAARFITTDEAITIEEYDSRRRFEPPR